MHQYIEAPIASPASAPRHGWLFLSAVFVSAFMACGDAQRADRGAEDSAAGALAVMQQGGGPQPVGQDVPVADSVERASPAPALAQPPVSRPPVTRPWPTSSSGRPIERSTPRSPSRGTSPDTPPPAAPAIPVTGTVDPGTSMTFLANTRVCSHLTGVGEKFTARLAGTVAATNGLMVPEGATGVFEVTAARTAQGNRDETYLRLRLISIQFASQTYPVQASVQTASTERLRTATNADDAKKVASGAVIGAIAGQVLGRGTRGTVLGAAAGAAAGSAAAAMTGNYNTCLAEGGSIRVALSAPLTIRPALIP